MRSALGAAQENWLSDTLIESKRRSAVWRIVGQQIIFSQVNLSGSYNVDAWDGYIASRKRVLDVLVKNDIRNTIILAGDSHANWVSELAYPNDTTTYDPVSGQGSLGVEFAGTAVTSGSGFGRIGATPATADALSRQLVDANRVLQWSEGHYRGFFTLTITPTELDATYYALQNISFPNFDHFVSAKFNIRAGTNQLTRPVAGGATQAGVLKGSS